MEWVLVYKQQEYYYTKHIHLRRIVDVMENGKATTECADILMQLAVLFKELPPQQ